MDPASVFGIASGSVALVKVLAQSVLGVKNMALGIRDIEDSMRGFGEELGAFEFSLTILDYELRKGTMMPEIERRWEPARLDTLLHNAMKTFSRLERMFAEINRRRGLLQNVREYYRSARYDEEIRHLRLRINTYTTALHIPVVLLAIQGCSSPTPPPHHDMSYSVLGDRILQLEQSIDNVSNGIRSLATSQAQRAADPPIEMDTAMQDESEELVEIARSLAASATSVASSEGARSSSSTIRQTDEPEQPIRLDEGVNQFPDPNLDSLSIRGLPLSTHTRHRVNDWIQAASVSGDEGPTSGGQSTAPSMASLVSTETSSASKSQYTPPSTVRAEDEADEDDDIELELVKLRYKKAKNLIANNQAKKAVPHLRKILADMDNFPAFLQEIIETRQDIQKLTATAMTMDDFVEVMRLLQEEKIEEAIPLLRICLRNAIDTMGEFETPGVEPVDFFKMYLGVALVHADPKCTEAASLLREVYQSPLLAPGHKLRASHALALHLYCLEPADRTEARSFCLLSVKGRLKVFGRKHTETYESIALLVKICEAEDDSDAEIWREMLPDDFPLPVIAPSPSNKPILAKAMYDMNTASHLALKATYLVCAKNDTIKITDMATKTTYWQGENMRTGEKGKIFAFYVVLNNTEDYVRCSTKLTGKIVANSPHSSTPQLDAKHFSDGDRITVVDFKGFREGYIFVSARNERTGQVAPLHPNHVGWDG